MKNKNNYIVLIILGLVIILLVTACIYMFKYNASSNKTCNNNSSNTDNMQLSKQNIIECINETTENNTTINRKYILYADLTGKLLSYDTIYTYTYSTLEEFNNAKNTDIKDSKVIEDKKQIVKEEKDNKLYNSKNEEADMWYKDYSKSLESMNYSCRSR